MEVYIVTHEMKDTWDRTTEVLGTYDSLEKAKEVTAKNFKDDLDWVMSESGDDNPIIVQDAGTYEIISAGAQYCANCEIVKEEVK